MDLDEILHPRRPSRWSLFVSSPALYIARLLYAARPQPSECETDTVPIAVVCISDTHNKQPALPDGDILIHAGDLTQLGTQKELQDQIDWLNSQPHAHKVVIAGNHDQGLASYRDSNESQTTNPPLPTSKDAVTINWGSITYLSNTSSTVTVRNRTLNVFGSPWTRKNGNWAFQYPFEQGGDVWMERIPDDTDILVTHSPLVGHLDTWDGWGCEWLLREVWRVVGRQRRAKTVSGTQDVLGNGSSRLKLCVFGHIHAGYGVERVWFDEVQRLYEKVVVAHSNSKRVKRRYSLGTWAFGMVERWTMVGKMLWAVVCNTRIDLGGLFENHSVVQLVNAAHVGGFRDRTLREPIVVLI